MSINTALPFDGQQSIAIPFSTISAHRARSELQLFQERERASNINCNLRAYTYAHSYAVKLDSNATARLTHNATHKYSSILICTRTHVAAKLYASKLQKKLHTTALCYSTELENIK